MALLKSKLLVAVLASVALAGCDTVSDVVFPSLGSSGSSSSGIFAGEDGPPQLGTTYFEPDGVSPGQPTGTVVGQRAVAYRTELTSLQDMIREQNAQLQALRNKTIQDSNAYHENVAAMRARLQVGTTPSNPILMNRWEAAQAQLNTISGDIVLMNQLAQMISVNQGTSSYLLDSVRSSFAMPGAVDEDHRQLRVLEDETQQTVVLIDRLLNELGADIRRQQAYVNNEKGNLGGLAVAIRNGQLFGFGGALSGAPVPTGPLAQSGGFAPAAAATTFSGGFGPQTASLAPVNLAGQRPLVVIRFERPSVAYQGALSQAVSSALQRKPNAVFDVVAVSPTSAGSANFAPSSSRRHAEQVARSMSTLGVGPERVRLSATVSPGVTVEEVRVFAQ